MLSAQSGAVHLLRQGRFLRFLLVGMVVMSYVFSAFITASARYSLVYGSLASLILLMFWLYLCCQIIYLGAALNIAIRDVCGEPGSKE